MKNKEKKSLVRMKPNHRMLIDEYFANGFNAVKAALSLDPAMNYIAASAFAQGVLKNKDNEEYIREKEADIRANASITVDQIVKERINWAFADITDFAGLNELDLKDLTPGVRRTIQSYEVDKETKEITKIKLVDKDKSLDALSRFIGLYAADNKQRKSSINLTKIDTGTLNMLLNAANDEED